MIKENSIAEEKVYFGAEASALLQKYRQLKADGYDVKITAYRIGLRAVATTRKEKKFSFRKYYWMGSPSSWPGTCRGAKLFELDSKKEARISFYRSRR